MNPLHFVITCEHAVNTIPPAYARYFEPHRDLLKTHRGYDIGALGIAQSLADALRPPFFQATTSRLLIDNNRSLSHPACFSFITSTLPETLKHNIIEDYYQPYRQPILQYFKHVIAKKQTILHFSIHSFTPVFDDVIRKGDLCLLYDPSRRHELQFAKRWCTWLKAQAPDLIIRRNYPYVGKSDGLASHCRTLFNEQEYIGFEIESNQAKVIDPATQTRFGLLLSEMVGTGLVTPTNSGSY